MQVAQGDVLVRICALVQAAIGYCTLLLQVPKMVLIQFTQFTQLYILQLAQGHKP